MPDNDHTLAPPRRSFWSPATRLCALGGALLCACTQSLIPNTDIEDTAMNRDLVDICERYRHAVELKDVEALMEMAHPDYYEDGGNVDATDDLDYAGLRKYLNSQFLDARAIRYEIHYRRVSKNESDGWDVAYTYSASYKLPDGEGELWHREVSENQLTLVPADAGYLIVSGM